MATYIVSRHPGAVEWVRKRLATAEEPRLVSHVPADQLFAPGDRVCGVLPVSLAARLCAQGAQPCVISVELPPALRGQELTASQLDQLGAELIQYRVEEVRRL